MMRPLAIIVSSILFPCMALGSVSFEPATTYPLPGLTTSLATGDFDRDGDVDVICVRSEARLVTLLMNDGSGQLMQAQSFAVAMSPYQSVVEDLNGDGFLDVVVAARGEIMLMFNDHVGSFTVAHIPDAGVPYYPAVGDFNEDGMPDIAVATGGNDYVLILLNRGSNQFEKIASINYGTFGGFTGIATADLNDDGYLDVIVRNRNGGWIRLLGNGDGTFISNVNFVYRDESYGVVARDLDGDGHVDLASGTTGGVEVYRGRGDGTFEPPLFYGAGLTCSSLQVADMDHNATLDLLAVNYSGNSISVLLSDGDGAFTLGAQLPTKPQPSCVKSADLNGDLKPDLVVGIAWSDELNVFLNETAWTGVEDEPIAGRGPVLSPNPVRRGSGIELRGVEGPATISMFDVTGRSVLTRTILSGRSSIHLPPHLAPGVYTIQVADHAHRHLRRIVVIN